MRRHQGLRGYHRPVMITEYQDKFLPPKCHTAQVLGSKNKNPYQQQLMALKTNKEDNRIRTGSGDDNERTLEIPAFRSAYVAQNWVNHPSKLPQVTNSNPMSPKKCCCAQFCPACTKEDNITIYKRDFQEWKVTKRPPFRHHDNLKVFQGVGAEDLDGKPRKPIEGTTSYRSSFIPHPVQPRRNQDKPRFQTSNFKLGDTTPVCSGHCSDPRKVMVNHSLTLRTKFPSDDRCDADRFRSTMQADFTKHKLQRTKPIIQARESQERSKEPFQGTTTMRDDYRQWDLQRRRSKDTKNNGRRGSDQISFSMNASEGNHCKRCHQSRDLDKRRGNGVQVECMTAGSTGYLPRSEVSTWIKCNMDKDQAQMVSCMVSSRN